MPIKSVKFNRQEPNTKNYWHHLIDRHRRHFLMRIKINIDAEFYPLFNL